MTDRTNASSARGARRVPGLPVALPALALLAPCALLTTGCVSKAEYLAVAQARDLCRTRYEQLQNQVDSAHREGEALEIEKSALATQKTVLEAKVTSLQSQGEEMDSKLKEQAEEARKLQETYDGLVADLNKELKAGQVEVKQLRDGLR